MQKLKRILALIGAIILLVTMLGISFMLFNAKHLSNDVFMGLLTCLIVIPIVAYGYSILLRLGNNIKKSLPKEDELDK